MEKQPICIGSDGAAVEGTVEGSGPTILFLHPGMADGASWSRVTERLAGRFRTVRLHRRTYRLDLDVDASTAMAAEVADIIEVVDALGTPVLLLGHSSGGVVALEALLAAPSKFSGAIIYEAPVPVAGPIGGEALRRAKAALARNRAGAAIRIFMREIVRYPAWLSWIFGALVSMVPSLRARVPRQLMDVEAIDKTGVRLDAYAAISVPVLLLLGDRSPSHLARRTDALNTAVHGARVVRMAGQEHTANRRAPDQVAGLIANFAAEVLATKE